MPDPMLALVSFVGLLGYSVVGGLVGAASVRLLGEKEPGYSGRGYGTYRHLRAIAGLPHADSEGWVGFARAAVFWPVAVAGAAVVGVGYGPYWITRHVGRYAAVAMLKESNDA